MTEKVFFSFLFVYSVMVVLLVVFNYRYMKVIQSAKDTKSKYNEPYYNSEYGVASLGMFKDILAYTTAKPNDKDTVAILSLSFDYSDTLLSELTKDDVLRILLLRIKDTLRASDFVAKSDDGTLYILLTRVNSLSGIEMVAQRLIKLCKSTVKMDTLTLVATPYIGVATYTGREGNESKPIDKVISNSKRAMLQLKEEHKEGFFFYNPDIEQSYKNAEVLVSDLKQALRNNEFVLHYQPQYDLQQKKLVGAEALIRWNHPEKGLIYPDKFIFIAENSDFINDLGLWVLREACRQHKDWGIDDFKVSVNISAEQFKSRKFVEQAINVINHSKINPRNLTLEITETVSIENKELTSNTLNKLRELGCKISVDDFGVGNSSLSYIKDLPIDYIKLDRSFILGLDSGNSGSVVLSSILKMAKELNLKTVVEGVETKEHLDFLLQTDCTEIQGYYLSRPITSEALYTFTRTEPYSNTLTFRPKLIAETP